MRKIIAWIVTLAGLGGSLLIQANWIANHLGFLTLPDNVRGALIAMSHIPTLFAALLLFIGIVGIVFLVHDYGLMKQCKGWTLQWPLQRKAGQEAEIELGIALNKALEQLRVEVEELKARVQSDREQAALSYRILRTSLRARDAKSIIKEADQVIMSTSKKLLEEPYPNKSAWAVDYEVWKAAVSRIDSLMSKWTQHHKPFLDLKDLELGAPVPPSQSNINSAFNVTRYKILWLSQQSYADRRKSIFIFFSSKAELFG